MFKWLGAFAERTGIRTRSSAFRHDVRGNTTIMFGLAATTLVTAAGAGVEFNQALQQRNRLQDAADAAALRGALLARDTSAAMKSADAVFALNLKDSAVTPTYNALSFKTNGSHKTAVYSATAEVETAFLNLLKIPKLTVSVTSTAEAELRKSEIALVLDSTGSMSRDSRMVELKKAVNTVLDSMLVGGKNVWDAQVAVVPFDTQVSIKGVPASGIAGEFGQTEYTYQCSDNVSTDRCNSMAATRDRLCQNVSNVSQCKTNARLYSYTSNGTYRVFATSYWEERRNCGFWSCDYYVIASRTEGYSTNSWARTSNSSDSTTRYYPTLYSLPNNNYAQFTGSMTAVAISAGGLGSGSTTDIKGNDKISSNDDLLGVGTDSWNGCVIDRKQPYDISGVSPTASNVDTLYPASKCATNNLLPIMGLTTNIQSAKDHVEKMTPAGNTNITIGVQWGMEVLSPELPFNTGRPYSDKTNYKYMIIVTDGENTQNRWSTSATAINERTKLACKAARDMGITVYTIRVMDGNSALLKDCASKPEYFYDVTASSQLTSTLAKVFYSIQSTRLTK